MDALFLKLLDMSLSASFVVLAVLLLRLILRKAPKWLTCALWVLVAVRLVCPFSFESTMSLMPEREVIQAQTGEIVALYSAPVSTSEQGKNTVSYAYYYAPASDGTRQIIGPAPAEEAPAIHWLGIGSIVWALGMSALLSYAAVSYLRLSRKVSASVDIGNGVYICDYIDTPFILGILKPKIYLSSAMEPADAAHVLAHERAHLGRKDHWWKPFGFALLAVHWFNPLIWVAYVLLCRDIELACDERVVKDMALTDKKAYSEALLKCSVPRHMIVACPLAFGEVGVKERVKSVLRYQKPAFWVVLMAVVVSIVAGVCFLTDPEATTLANFRDIREKEIVCIDVRSQKGELCLDSKEELAMILDVLENTEYDTSPISPEIITGSFDEYGCFYPFVEITYEDAAEILYFTYDYSQVWCSDSEEITQPHAVVNPDTLVQFMHDHVTPVVNRKVESEPFAAADAPFDWMRNIRSEAVKTVRMYGCLPDYTMKNSYLTYAHLDQLVSILHSIPENAITGGQVDAEFGYDDLRTFSGATEVGISLVITDGANDLTAILRLYEEKLELVILEDGAWEKESWKVQPAYARIWQIADENLRSFLNGLLENPPFLQTWLGSRYDLERVPAQVSYGNAFITTVMLTDWDYEIVAYTEGAESFGIRCRPKEESEGWIYFSFWPDGYDPMEEDRYYFEGYTNGYKQISSWPSAVSTKGGFDTDGYVFSYKKTEYPTGDYVMINDGADAWWTEQKYSDDILSFTTFTYGTDTREHGIRYGNVTVDFSSAGLEDGALLYFDWDKITEDLNTDTLTLLNAQYDSNDLFVTGQYGDKQCFLHFEKGDESGYTFKDIRYDNAGSSTTEAMAYSQCDDPSEGPHRSTFGTNDNNKGYFQIRSDWMSSIWGNDNIDYPHLFRFWPEGQTEGFISFAFMEGGFAPEDGLTVEEIALSEPVRPFSAYTATAEGDAHWRYLWIDVDGGSYLLRNDNADHWTDAQWEQAMEMIDNIVIAQYDVP